MSLVLSICVFNIKYVSQYKGKKVFFDKWQTETCRSKTLSKYYNHCRDTKINSAILISYSTKSP